MTSKMISIREDIYRDLKQLKGQNESFSEVIERLITKRKKDPLKNFGIFNSLPKEIMDDFENAIIEARKEDINGNLKKIF
ncbi:MAG: antitoxin VapB family protein [Promethearchaeota archaeon]